MLRKSLLVHVSVNVPTQGLLGSQKLLNKIENIALLCIVLPTFVFRNSSTKVWLECWALCRPIGLDSFTNTFLHTAFQDVTRLRQNKTLGSCTSAFRLSASTIRIATFHRHLCRERIHDM